MDMFERTSSREKYLKQERAAREALAGPHLPWVEGAGSGGAGGERLQSPWALQGDEAMARPLKNYHR